MGFFSIKHSVAKKQMNNSSLMAADPSPKGQRNNSSSSGGAAIDHSRRREGSSIWLDASDRTSDEQLQEELRKEVAQMDPHEIIRQLEEMAMSNTVDGKRKMSALKQISVGDEPPSEVTIFL